MNNNFMNSQEEITSDYITNLKPRFMAVLDKRAKHFSLDRTQFIKTDDTSELGTLAYYTLKNPTVATLTKLASKLYLNFFEFALLTSSDGDCACLGLTPAELNDVRSMLLVRESPDEMKVENQILSRENETLQEKLKRTEEELNMLKQEQIKLKKLDGPAVASTGFFAQVNGAGENRG